MLIRTKLHCKYCNYPWYNLHKLCVFLLLFCLYACTNNHFGAPVDDRSIQSTKPVSFHTVTKGETLYSIAWRYHMDYRELANANNVSSPYIIYPGQKLFLSILKNKRTIGEVRRVKNARKKRYNDNIKMQKSTTTISPKQKPQKKSEKTKVREKAAVIKQHNPWYWPLEGKILRQFSDTGNLNKGIDIQGKLGQAVHAAKNGVVVYSGNGLLGYGKLIIIEHDDHYMSAYAHNSKLLVTEGKEVIASQKIAEVGSSGTDQAKLHFEIRVKGKPLNPLKLLPRR